MNTNPMDNIINIIIIFELDKFKTVYAFSLTGRGRISPLKVITFTMLLIVKDY